MSREARDLISRLLNVQPSQVQTQLPLLSLLSRPLSFLPVTNSSNVDSFEIFMNSINVCVACMISEGHMHGDQMLTMVYGVS